MRNIAVLVSGGGTNLQALIDAQAAGKIPDGRIVRVIASREGVYALERARQHNIPSVVVSRRQFADQQLPRRSRAGHAANRLYNTAGDELIFT